MDDLIEKNVYDILDNLKDVGVENKQLIPITILHISQMLQQSSATSKKLLYKSMLDFVTKKDEVTLEYKCITNWELYGKNKKDIKINLIDDIKLMDYSSMFETKFKRITINKDIKGGNPCVKGSRISVMDVLSYLSNKRSYSEVMDEFPELKEEDIKECLEYSNYVLTNLFEYVRKGNK